MNTPPIEDEGFVNDFFALHERLTGDWQSPCLLTGWRDNGTARVRLTSAGKAWMDDYGKYRDMMKLMDPGWRPDMEQPSTKVEILFRRRYGLPDDIHKVVDESGKEDEVISDELLGPSGGAGLAVRPSARYWEKVSEGDTPEGDE